MQYSDEEFWILFAGYLTSVNPESINKADGPFSTLSQSTEVPYPMGVFENKVHPESLEQSYASATQDNLPESFGEESNHQDSSNDKPHTLTLAQIKTENKEADEEYEIDEEARVRSVMPNTYDTPETTHGTVFSDGKLISFPMKANEILPVMPLKQEEINTNIDHNVTDEDAMRTESMSVNKSMQLICGFTGRPLTDGF